MHGVTTLVVTVVVATLAAPCAGAQQAAPLDTVVADRRLGGDSAQATFLGLRGNTVYVVEITPRTALIQLRLQGRELERPLLLRSLSDRTPPTGGIAFAITPSRPGRYLLELTNPGVGATRVRVLDMSPEAAPVVVARAYEPPVVVLEETYPGPPNTILLTGDIAYRIEVTPPAASAAVAIRSAHNSSGPPMVLYPMGGGQGLILIPPSTGEYRVDVAAGDEPVRVRIMSDPQETAHWLRVAEQTRGLPGAGISVRGAWIGAFAAPDSSNAEGVGADFCFGVIPRGGWVSGPFGGCALSVSYYSRARSAGRFVLSVAPRIVLSQPQREAQISLALSAGIGGTTRAGRSQSYWVFGAGIVLDQPIAGPHLQLEVEAGFASMDPIDQGNSATVPRMSLGLQYRP